MHDAAQVTDILADSVVQPALTNAMATSSVAARAGLDRLVHGQVLSPSVVRIKLWTPEGQIIYSDEKQLVGTTFHLDGGAIELDAGRYDIRCETAWGAASTRRTPSGSSVGASGRRGPTRTSSADGRRSLDAFAGDWRRFTAAVDALLPEPIDGGDDGR